MTNDLISRADAYKVLTDYYHHRTEFQHEALKEALDRVPSAQPKRGEWIVYEGGWKDLDYYPPKCKCNQCGYEEDLYILNAKPTNFCSNCGARMAANADQCVQHVGSVESMQTERGEE